MDDGVVLLPHGNLSVLEKVAASCVSNFLKIRTIIPCYFFCGCENVRYNQLASTFTMLLLYIFSD